MAASPAPSAYQEWMDPGMQECAAIVRRAFPSDTIGSPPNPNGSQAASDSSDTPYAAVETACQDLAIFAKIADAAGKRLTVASFTKAGYQLKTSLFPGQVDPCPSDPISLMRSDERMWWFMTPDPRLWWLTLSDIDATLQSLMDRLPRCLRLLAARTGT